MSNNKEIVNNLELELRRGTIILCVLSQLEQPKYGYALVETLEQKGMRVEPGTLYPLLRRLEKQALLTSEWETSQNKPRKYYVLTDTGRDVYGLLCEAWTNMKKNINNMIKGEP